MDSSQKKLENYISKILEIQNKKRLILKPKDLKEIALEMGMTETQWQKISDTFNAHALRGKGFIDFKNWEDAIIEFEQAYTLNPYNTDVLYALALSNKELWLQTKQTKYKEKANEYAKNCINIDPQYTNAIKLISELKKENKVTKKNKTLFILLAVLFFILLFFTIIFYKLQFQEVTGVSTSSTQKEIVPIEKETTKKVVQETQNSISVKKENINIPNTQNDNLLKISLLKNEQSKGLTYISESLKSSKYDNSYSISAKGYFKLKGIEISELKIKIEAVDKNNKVILTKVKNLVYENSLTIRSGDLIPFNFLFYENEANMPDFKLIRLSVNFVKKEPATLNYSPSKLLTVDWEIEKPQNFDIEVRERLNSISNSFRKNNIFNKIVLEVKNTGKTTINQLKLQIKWRNKQNKTVKTEEVYITITSYSPLKCGYTFVYERTFGIKNLSKENYNGYFISVLEIK